MDDNEIVEVTETPKIKKKLWKKIVKGLLIFFAIMFISGTVALGVGYIKYGPKIQSTIKNGNTIAQSIIETDFNTRKPTQFYDNKGKLIKEFKTVTYYYTKEADLNPFVGQAVTSIEDQRFYEHNGIDYQGIQRSIWVYIKSKGTILQGGSTITQQLARNVFLSFDVTIWRKLEESVIAKDLEQKYTKAQILEFYVNNVNFGNGCYSIESASKYYFQKTNKDLDISQIAMLAGIPNNPSFYSPITHMSNAIKRRNLVLDKMLSLKKITQSEYDKATSEVITLNVKPAAKTEPMDSSIQYAVHNATVKLMEEDGFVSRYSFNNDNDRKTYFTKYNDAYAEKEKQLLAGRYRIDTSIDTAKQKKLQSVVDSKLEQYTQKDYSTKLKLYEKQGASVTIDNSTGEVVAIVGGRSQDGNTFNRAFLAARQPGSSIKPLIAYTPAFERGYIPSSQYIDAPIANGPSNDDFAYRGSVTLKYALDISINTIPVRLVGSNGVKKSLQYLQNMEFKYITPEDDSSIVGIGGFTKGVTPVEMASGYSALSRNGEFISPTNIRKITNTVINEVLFENTHKQTKVYNSGASYLTTDTLKSVLTESYSTGRGLSLNDYPFAAGKTGTTDKSKDCWFIGYTPYYTTSVWVGDDTPAAQNMFGANEPGQIWKEYMEYLHQGLVQKDFVRPNTVVTRNGVLMDTLYIKLHPNGSKIKSVNTTKLQTSTSADAATKEALLTAQEKSNETSASNAISALEGFSLTDKSQYAKYAQLVQNASAALQNVTNKSTYSQMQARLQSMISIFSNAKTTMDNAAKTETPAPPTKTTTTTTTTKTPPTPSPTPTPTPTTPTKADGTDTGKGSGKGTDTGTKKNTPTTNTSPKTNVNK
ncbi:MAG TPA: transglycosylase domain-containing protein [Clostridium sp.]